MMTSNSSKTPKTTTSINTKVSIDSQSSAASDDSQSVDNVPKAVSDMGYRIGAKLGSGAYATVYKATNVRKPGELFACKRFDLTDKTQELWREKCLKSEMKIMLRLKHSNIIKAFDAIKTKKMGFIFMAFAANGSIGELLEKIKSPIEERQSKKWFHQISSAVDYMHSKGIAHRDIKPDNFLLDGDNKALLSDFGFSCIAIDNERLMKGTNCGTELYKSPELVSLMDGHVYDAKMADMYAMGVSLFEMLNFNKPFGESIGDRVNYSRKQKTRKYHFNKKVKLSTNAIKCLEELLESDHNRRITSQALLKHKWFQPLN